MIIVYSYWLNAISTILKIILTLSCLTIYEVMLISQWFPALSQARDHLLEPLGTAGTPTTRFPSEYSIWKIGFVYISQDISQGYVNIYDAIPFVCQCKNSSSRQEVSLNHENAAPDLNLNIVLAHFLPLSTLKALFLSISSLSLT